MFKLNPYVRYNNAKCKEAFTFYQSILGGELFFQTAGESPMAKDIEPEKHGLVMHAQLKGPGFILFGSDMMRDVAKVGDNFSLSLNYEDDKDYKTHFEKLSEGGEVFMPLEEVFWGAVFGMVTDKYGIEWMFNYEKKK
jgi:PhnB protein